MSDPASTTSVATSTTTTSVSAAGQTTITTTQTIGQQAFQAYRQALAVVAEIAESPTGRSTDPRLRAVLIDPFYSEVVQEINLYRLRNQVVRGSYSISNFRLDAVTADGRVIFTDCQTNSQALYSATTGALVGNGGTSEIPEQVVVYRNGPAATFQVADDNQGSAVTAARNACAA
jgi:hypothetical protein